MALLNRGIVSISRSPSDRTRRQEVASPRGKGRGRGQRLPEKRAHRRDRRRPACFVGLFLFVLSAAGVWYGTLGPRSLSHINSPLTAWTSSDIALPGLSAVQPPNLAILAFVSLLQTLHVQPRLVYWFPCYILCLSSPRSPNEWL